MGGCEKAKTSLDGAWPGRPVAADATRLTGHDIPAYR